MYLNYGWAGGDFADVTAAPTSITVIGPELLGQLSTVRAEHQQRILRVSSEQGIDPLIGATYSLGDAARAHRDLEDRTLIGKALLIP